MKKYSVTWKSRTTGELVTLEYTYRNIWDLAEHLSSVVLYREEFEYIQSIILIEE